jgi:hypothetical protein
VEGPDAGLTQQQEQAQVEGMADSDGSAGTATSRIEDWVR